MSNSAETSDSKHPLHNFSLPPFFKWGTQRILRCTRLPSSRSDPSRSSESDKMRSSVIDSEERHSDFHGSPAAARPWNLRTRLSACHAPPQQGSPSTSGRGNWDLGRREKVESPGRLRMGIQCGVKRVRKFSIALSKQEVELDFLKMFGTRPPRRPKKRPRILQKQVDLICPGLWLTEITADRYKVPELSEPLKCSRRYYFVFTFFLCPTREKTKRERRNLFSCGVLRHDYHQKCLTIFNEHNHSMQW